MIEEVCRRLRQGETLAWGEALRNASHSWGGGAVYTQYRTEYHVCRPGAGTEFWYVRERVVKKGRSAATEHQTHGN